MSAERLRQAATLMRERAKVGDPAEFPSPWSASPDDHHHNTYEILCHDDGSGLVTDLLDRDIAAHIASWHPAVALAVANWLDEAAESWRLGVDFSDAALAVADAYLGEPA